MVGGHPRSVAGACIHRRCGRRAPTTHGHGAPLPADQSSQALVVGVSQYKYLSKLQKTKNALAVRDVLASTEYCGYPPARVTLLEEDEATRDNIINALRTLCQTAKGPDARTFFYFWGHGGEGSDGTPYIFPVDAHKDEYPRTAISAADLSQCLDQCWGELTVVLDTCHAASMARLNVTPDSTVRSDADEEGPELGPFTDSLRNAIRSREPAEKRSTKRVLIAASRARGKAFKSLDAPYSIFTGHMLDCLRGAESNATGGSNVTVQQLFSYLERQVAHESGGGQKPLFIGETESLLYPLTNYPRAIPPGDDFRADVFISYDQDDLVLEDWIKNIFRLELESHGISISDYDDVGQGEFAVGEVIEKTRYTIALLTRAYLRDHFDENKANMAALQAIDSGDPRFIPILRERFNLPLYIKRFVVIDMTPAREMYYRREMDKLVRRLKKQPHEP